MVKHKVNRWLTQAANKATLYWAECPPCGWGPIIKYEEADRDVVADLHENPEEAMKLKAPSG